VGATLMPESTRYELRDQAQQAATKLLAGL
jgi:hypothetical protein